MSLNGLDSAEVAAAHTKTIAEPAGWFLLKYATRDEVQLLSSGTGGFSEARDAIAKHDEESPLFGLVVHKKKKALLKYVPEGTSRLLQARLAVHVQSVIERFQHDALLSLTTAAELTEPVLATSLATLKSSGSIKNGAPRSQRHLTEIREDSDDESSRKQSNDTEQSNAIDKEIDENETSPAVAEPVASPESRAFSLDSDKAAPRDSQDTQASRSSINKSLEQEAVAHERPSYESRPSDSFARPQTAEAEQSWTYRPKLKLGPRPSLDAGQRSQASGSFSRNVSTLPAGIRIGPKSPGYPPKSPGFERPRTGSSMKSFSGESGRFAAVPSPRADSASSRQNSVVEIPEVPAIPPEHGRWGVAPSPRADSISHKAASPVAETGNGSHNEEPEEPYIDPSIPPEKQRLMKALNQRKKNKIARKGPTETRASVEPQVPPVPQLLPPPTKMLQRKGSSLKIDSALPSVLEHQIEPPLQTPSPKTYAPSPRSAPSPKTYMPVPPSPRSIPDTIHSGGHSQSGHSAFRGRLKIAAPKHGEDVQAWASRVQKGARPAFNFPRSSYVRTPSFPRSAGSSRSGSMTRRPSFGRSGSNNQKGSFARTNSAGVERGSLRKRKPTLTLEYLSDAESSDGEEEPAENLFGAEPSDVADSRISSNAASSVSSEPSRGRPLTKEFDVQNVPRNASILEESAQNVGEDTNDAPHDDKSTLTEVGAAIQVQSNGDKSEQQVAESGDVDQPESDEKDTSSQDNESKLVEESDQSTQQMIAEPAKALTQEANASESSETVRDDSSSVSREDVPAVPAETQVSAKPAQSFRDFPLGGHDANITQEDSDEAKLESVEDVAETPNESISGRDPEIGEADVPRASETLEADESEFSNKAITRSISTKSQGESETNVDVSSPATELSAAPTLDIDAADAKEIDTTVFTPGGSLIPASEEESQTPHMSDLKHQSISTIASDESRLTTKPSNLRLDTSKHNSSEVASVDGDALFEELKTATVEQATPLMVPKSPGAYAFPVDMRPVSRDPAQLIHISSSSPGPNGSPDKSTFGSSSANTDGTESRASTESGPVKLNIQKVRAIEDLRRTPSVSSVGSRDGAVSPSGRKASGVSKLISARIKAFEKNGSSGSSPPMASTAIITPSIVSQRKASLTTPPGSSGRDVGLAASRPSSRPYPTPSPSPHANMVGASGTSNQRRNENMSSRSAALRPTFLRADSSSSSKKSSQASSPVVEGSGTYFATRKEKKGSISSASSVVESIREGLASHQHSSSSRRNSRKSNDTVRADTGSPRSPASESAPSSDGGDSSSMKKGSKRSRLMRRMSSIAMSPRRSIARQTIDESHEPDNRKWTATAVGDINVQFPDTLLWKRRHMHIDGHGYIVLEPAKTDKASKIAAKQYHISEFYAPYIPDQDRAELPHSIIMDFMDSSTLQCACESAANQGKLLQVLAHAHRSFSKQH